MKKLIASLAVVAFVAACATKEQPAQVAETKTPPTTGTGSTSPPPVVQPKTDQPIPGKIINPLVDPKNVLSSRVIYFDYDKDVVKPEFQALVQAHAKFLSENRTRKIRLEGHADERGSREYNMALGQRRADAVRKAVSVLGVSGDRVETVSFGEDKPKATGHDEAAWAQNRRVEIVYDGE